MNDAALSSRLPHQRATKIAAGYGEGTPCAVCNLPMHSSEVMYELSFDDDACAPSLRVHLRCFDRWERMQAVSVSGAAACGLSQHRRRMPSVRKGLNRTSTR